MAGGCGMRFPTRRPLPAWFRRIRPKHRSAQAAEADAEAATASARAVVGAARAAVRAAEEMLEKHSAAAQAAAERAAQGEIDEFAGRGGGC